MRYFSPIQKEEAELTQDEFMVLSKKKMEMPVYDTLGMRKIRTVVIEYYVCITDKNNTVLTKITVNRISKYYLGIRLITEYDETYFKMFDETDIPEMKSGEETGNMFQNADGEEVKEPVEQEAG